MGRVSYPKIELHVHLEGAVRPRTLLDIAGRNGVALPAGTVDGIGKLYEFTDFSHFVDVWILTTNAMRTADDFRQITVDYAAEAAGHGAVYVEAIFSPIERVARGVDWDELFEGYTDGAQQAEEEHGVIVRLTPDAYRGADIADVETAARYAVKYRDRGVVGFGIGGVEKDLPPEPYAKAFAIARDGGLGAVPHAGETAGADSIRTTMRALGANRLRHGIRAADDPELMQELAVRNIVLDVCPTSNLRTKAVSRLDEHPLPKLVNAGITCTVNTDDPAMFNTDLGREHDIANRLGVRPKDLYEAGVRGALCDATTKNRLAVIGNEWEWQ